MSWVKIEHKGGGLFEGHYNAADWLAEKLNELGTTNHPVILEYDKQNGVLDAIVYIGDEHIMIDDNFINKRGE